MRSEVRPSGRSRVPGGTVQRFSDVDHHVIEQAALEEVFHEAQLRSIEAGNMQREYSQLPMLGNLLLLGLGSRFGGYARHEPFDHFVFDRERDRWWDTLQAEDHGLVADRMRRLQRATPVTVNQTPGSPLRAVEATRFSPWKALGLGTSLPQGAADRDDRVRLITGLQLSGSFDENRWFRKRR